MDAKGIARALRVQLHNIGHDVTHSEALELVAKCAGLKDWNILSAQDSPIEEKSHGLFCPHCGRQGTVTVEASAFVEQGPYIDETYAFEGDAEHYVCGACGAQFLNWSSLYPQIRKIKSILVCLSHDGREWCASLVLAGDAMAAFSGEESEASLIERVRRENALWIKDGATPEGVTLIEELPRAMVHRVFKAQSVSAALKLMREELALEPEEISKQITGLPEGL